MFRQMARRVPVIGNKIDNTLEQVWLIGQNKKAVIICAVMSMGLQFLNVCALYTVSYPFMGEGIKLAYAFTFIPIGFIAVAIPISPAGLGVGHVAFEKLFGYFSIDGGANFFNLYFLSLVFINLFGFIPYIMSGKRHSLKEAKNLAKSRQLLRHSKILDIEKSDKCLKSNQYYGLFFASTIGDETTYT